MHSPGPNLNKIDHVTDLKDFQIVATDSQKEAFKSSIQAGYIQAIVDQLYNRFPHVELLDAFSIFDSRTLPFDEKDVATHGQERLEVLLDTFVEDSVDRDQCTSEWECLKRLIHNYSSLTLRQMLRLLCTDQSLQDMFPQLSKLSTLADSVPVSTAECERAFSAMNRIKTELRNRLKTSTLDCLMRISIEGPPSSGF